MDPIIDLTDHEDSCLQNAEPQPSIAETSCSPPKLAKTLFLFTFFEVFEILYEMGLDSVELWSQVVPELVKACKGNPALENISEGFQTLLRVLRKKLLGSTNSADKIQFLKTKRLSFFELKTILKSELDLMKNIVYLAETTRLFQSIARRIINPHTKQVFKKLKKTPVEDEDFQQDSTACVRDDDQEKEFEKLFSVSANQSKPVTISQNFFQNSNGKRHQITSPGETGTHLVKIELTEMKDLKGVETKNYWTKVFRKGYFVLDTNKPVDKETFVNINSILLKAGKKIKNIENSRMINYEDQSRPSTSGFDTTKN